MNILFSIYMIGLCTSLLVTALHAAIFEEFGKWHARIMFVSLVWPMAIPYLGIQAVVGVFKGIEWLWERAEFPASKRREGFVK